MDVAEQIEQVWDSYNVSGRINLINTMGLNLIFGQIDRRFFSELTQTNQRMLILSATAMQKGLSLLHA